MKKIPNPNGNKFVLPKGYTDLGWQLDFNASELKKCREALKSSCHPRSVYPFGKTHLFPVGFGIFFILNFL